MEVFVNGSRESQLPPHTGETDELIREIGVKLYHEGQLIVKVEVDGQDVTGIPSGEWNLDVEPARLDLHTQSPNQLIAQSVNISSDWLGPLRREITACADRFRMGEEAPAIDHLVKVVEGLRLLMAGVTQIDRLLVGLRPDIERQDVQVFQDTMNKHFDEVISAQESRDWILLADVLEYDINEHLETWESTSSRLTGLLA